MDHKAYFFVNENMHLEIIDECGLLGAKLVGFSMENHKLALASGRLLAYPSKYQRLIGRLINLTIIRLDLTNIIHILSQIRQASREEHMDAARRMLRYLKGTIGQGILMRVGEEGN